MQESKLDKMNVKNVHDLTKEEHFLDRLSKRMYRKPLIMQINAIGRAK